MNDGELALGQTQAEGERNARRHSPGEGRLHLYLAPTAGKAGSLYAA